MEDDADEEGAGAGAGGNEDEAAAASAGEDVDMAVVEEEKKVVEDAAAGGVDEIVAGAVDEIGRFSRCCWSSTCRVCCSSCSVFCRRLRAGGARAVEVVEKFACSFVSSGDGCFWHKSCSGCLFFNFRILASCSARDVSLSLLGYISHTFLSLSFTSLSLPRLNCDCRCCTP